MVRAKLQCSAAVGSSAAEVTHAIQAQGQIVVQGPPCPQVILGAQGKGLVESLKGPCGVYCKRRSGSDRI